MKYFKAKYILIFLILIQGCKSEKKNYFPSEIDIKWMYSINIHSSYKDEMFLKRIMITNVKKDKKDTRLKHVYLNEKGNKLFNEIFSIQKKRIYKALLNSSSKEVINFNNVLNKIINEKI